MATPHDDAPPHEPDCLPPEPCVCAGLRASADTVTTADLDLVDRLDAIRLGPRPIDIATQGLRDLGVTLLPRLARELRLAIGDPETYAYQHGLAKGRREAERDAHTVIDALNGRVESLTAERDHAVTRGRREAIEEAARHIRAHRDICIEKLKTETDEGEIEALDLCRETLDAAAEGIEKHEAERAVKP